MAERKVGEFNYRIGVLAALPQLHVFRRLGVDGDNGYLASNKSDAEVDYVVKSCLAVVERQQGAAWAPVVSPEATKGDPTSRQLMFTDLKFLQLTELVGYVIRENFADFFPTGDRADSAPATPPTTPG